MVLGETRVEMLIYSLKLRLRVALKLLEFSVELSNKLIKLSIFETFP